MKKTIFLTLLLASFWSSYCRAQQSDNEDGTFTNPIIWSDFPDNDVIRVGDTYYMVCTTMYFFPGVPVLKSKDLVNWQYVTNAVKSFKQDPAYDMSGGTRYGHGQWASSIRYHDGKFYILFLTLDEGGFLCTADRAEGPWKLQKLPKAFYDSGLFFDDDGRNYVVSGFSKLSLTEVDKNIAPVSKDSVIVSKVLRKGLEGSHMYKINEYYYIYATYGGGDGFQVCLRSRSIYGPYEEKIVLRDDMNQPGKGVHQGALIETQKGEWWSVIFQDRDGVGRVPTLQPVTWTDNWPIVGENGRAVVTYRKPNVGKKWPVEILPTSDEFNTDSLGGQWAWNHNPDDNSWSLTSRKGYLRLSTANVAKDLTLARNTLTQRLFGPFSVGTAAFDIAHMLTGDIAGLGVLQLPYAFIGVKASGPNKKTLLMVNNGKVVDSIPSVNATQLYFRSSVNTTSDKATFYYSFDNKKFHRLGDTLYMKFDLKMFTGNRFAIFNYATRHTGGYVDCNWFRMRTRKGPPNLFNAQTAVEARYYDEALLAKTIMAKGPANDKKVVVEAPNGSTVTFNRVSFSRECRYWKLKASSQAAGATVGLFVDDDLETPLAVITIPSGAGNQADTYTAAIKPLAGIHKITLRSTTSDNGSILIDKLSFSSAK